MSAFSYSDAALYFSLSAGRFLHVIQGSMLIKVFLCLVIMVSYVFSSHVKCAVAQHLLEFKWIAASIKGDFSKGVAQAMYISLIDASAFAVSGK